MEVYDGKTLLISGATGGIGKSIAKFFSNYECTIISVHKHDTMASREFISNLSDNKAIVFDLIADLSDIKKSNSLEIFLQANNIKIDIIINCIGVFIPSLVSSVDITVLEKSLHNNLYAPINLINFALPFFNLNENSRIINVSSVAANIANIGQGIYAIAKSALNTYTKCLSQELFRYKIPVNSVSPGFVNTSMSTAYYQKFVKEVPFKRFAEPSEIARSVIYLASPDAKYITGQNIIVDGGFSNKNI